MILGPYHARACGHSVRVAQELLAAHGHKSPLCHDLAFVDVTLTSRQRVCPTSLLTF